MKSTRWAAMFLNRLFWIPLQCTLKEWSPVLGASSSSFSQVSYATLREGLFISIAASQAAAFQAAANLPKQKLFPRPVISPPTVEPPIPRMSPHEVSSREKTNWNSINLPHRHRTEVCSVSYHPPDAMSRLLRTLRVATALNDILGNSNLKKKVYLEDQKVPKRRSISSRTTNRPHDLRAFPYYWCQRNYLFFNYLTWPS